MSIRTKTNRNVVPYRSTYIDASQLNAFENLLKSFSRLTPNSKSITNFPVSGSYEQVCVRVENYEITGLGIINSI